MSDEWLARMGLGCVYEPGSPEIARIVANYGAVDAWERLKAGSGPLSHKARLLDLPAVVREGERLKLRFLIPSDEEWPPRLADLGRCPEVSGRTGEPLGLWARGGGRLAELVADSVALVGSRAATAYGERTAGEIAGDLSNAGYAVVSGGAFGIDAAAPRGCHAGRTPTVAVLAGGLDSPYPPSNFQLFERVAERGVVVSEFAPGEHPTRLRFLGRNRLIAALSQGTVIVEGSVRSGARNTVSWALALGRPAMAVPGPVNHANSFTPHQLIREGEAVLVSGMVEVLELLRPKAEPLPRPESPRRPTDGLSENQLRVYDALPKSGSRSVTDLSLQLGMRIPDCLATLRQLDELGMVRQNMQQAWQLRREQAA
ncbi:MAG: DNA-processing protein DprA [Propionibacteriaceae bacterium]|jgi:DNA processing protein|nr:DNA-processing protein DprA [Propionibacteriaceae bacterium]